MSILLFSIKYILSSVEYTFFSGDCMETSMIKTLADLASATSNISEILLHYYKKIGFDKTPTGSTAPTVEPRPSTGNTYGNHQAMPMGEVKKMPASEMGITRVNDMSSYKAMSVDDVKKWSASETGINRVNDMPSFINQFGGHVGAQTDPSDTVKTIPDPNVRISNGGGDTDRDTPSAAEAPFRDPNMSNDSYRKYFEKKEYENIEAIKQCANIDKELPKFIKKKSPTTKKKISKPRDNSIAAKPATKSDPPLCDKK